MLMMVMRILMQIVLHALTLQSSDKRIFRRIPIRVPSVVARHPATRRVPNGEHAALVQNEDLLWCVLGVKKR